MTAEIDKKVTVFLNTSMTLTLSMLRKLNLFRTEPAYNYDLRYSYAREELL